MIFAHGTLLPDSALPALLDGLEEEINATRATRSLSPETVISALDELGKRLESGEFDALLRQYLPAGVGLDDLLPLLRRKTLEHKLKTELGDDPFSPVDHGGTTARRAPLGTLLHVAAGNMPGLPVYSVVEGLLCGNVNLLKLPHGDKGLSLAALSLLCQQERSLAGFIYAFGLPSSDVEAMKRLCRMADGVVTWGGDGAITALRSLAPPGCKLMEWGHRLGFAYVSGFENEAEELSSLARHIIATGQRLCSSCQVIFLDTADRGSGEAFCETFLPYLEQAAAQLHTPPELGAQATLSGQAALLCRIAEGRAEGEALFPGKGCSVIFRPDEELELSPMEGNVLIKLLPQDRLLPALRRQKGRLQTAGLICEPEKREALTELLLRAGATRVTRAGSLSRSFPGEAHDGEYPLRRYTRIVDVER